MSRRLIGLMAVATGTVVANLYYAQPLLHQIAGAFHAGTTASSAIITFTQLGYALGLLLVVPLGDLYARRSLVPIIYLTAAVALVICASSPSLLLFSLGSVLVGCASVAGQVMIPFAADLAPEERRGRVVARLTSGLLIGILLARTASGVMAELAGWRSIYWLSAAVMVLFAVVLWRLLPSDGERPAVSYRRLVAGSIRMIREEPLLRRRAFHGAAAFAAFSTLWTTLAFLLSASPYGYSEIVIGLFGLAGVAGVAAANIAGRLADTERSRLSTVLAGCCVAGSFGLLALGKTDLAALVAGIVVLDLGTQGMQITNQAIIYALRPDARSRITSAYMVCYFIGGAIGSLAAGAVLASAGWYGVCVLGACFGLASLGLVLVRWLIEGRAGPNQHVLLDAERIRR